MYSLYLGNAVASFVSGYVNGRKFSNNMKLQPQISNVSIEEIRKDIINICKEKICEYCGRVNKFMDNCKGCGAPC